MIWAQLLAYATGAVNQELLLRNEYLAAENRILKAQIKVWFPARQSHRTILWECRLPKPWLPVGHLQLAFLFPRLNKEEEKALLEKRLKELEQQPLQKQRCPNAVG